MHPKILTSWIYRFSESIESQAHYKLAKRLVNQDELNEAIDSLKIAIQLKPEFPEAHYSLGNALIKRGEITAAIDSFKTAIQLKPNFAEAHNQYGVALECKGDLVSATRSYETALELKANFPEAEFNLSLVMLLNGDYINGWKKYESRSRREKDAGKPHALPNCKVWNGESLQPDTELLLVAEQGYGDTLQFMRYALALKKRGITTSLCAQPKLHSLIQASGIDASPLTPDQANQVTGGYWLPLLSLPKHLEVSKNDPIITKPYIKTTDELSNKWRRILSEEQRPIIGINWQGNPAVEISTLRGRSLALETFAPITTQANATLLSLQKGFGSEQLATCSFKEHFVACQNQVNEAWDFLETAAIIANCDLVITSDTSIAHLAGGMGKETWLLLQKIPDWRWGLESNTTFWYPSIRLFRQTEQGNWGEVMQRVVFALQQKFGDMLLTDKSPRICKSVNEQSSDRSPISQLQDYRNSIFEAHADFALTKYLNPFYQTFSQSRRRHTRSDKKRLILIVDDRPSELLRFCILNSLLMTGFKYKCLIYTTSTATSAMNALFADIKDLVEICDLSTFGFNELNRDKYNDLLKTKQFWTKIPAKSVLLTQPDALLIEPLPDSFFEYDYIGAPWSPNKTLSISFPNYTDGDYRKHDEFWQTMIMNPDLNIPTKIGNGGHSIRSVNYMIAAATTTESIQSEPEDVFYARNRNQYHGRFPSLEEAQRFSCETSYSFSHSSHASHLYLEYHHQAEIYERHIKNLISLCNVNFA